MIRLLLAALLLLAPAAAQTPPPSPLNSLPQALNFGSSAADRVVCNQPGQPQTGRRCTPLSIFAAAFPGLGLPETYLPPGTDPVLLRNGTLDATGPANLAIAATGRVQFGCGTYKLLGSLAAVMTDGGAIVGSGEGCTTLRADFAAGPVITIGFPGGTTDNTPLYTVVERLRLLTTSPRSAGSSAIYVGTHKDARLRNLVIEGRWHDGIVVDGGGGHGIITYIDTFWTGTHDGTKFSGSCIRLTGVAIETRIQHGFQQGCGSSISFDSASGIYLDDISSIFHEAGGVVSNPGPGQSVNALFATKVLMDSGVGSGWQFIGTGPTTEIDLSGVWASQNGISPIDGTTVTNGTSIGLFATNPAIDGFKLRGSHFHFNAAHGIYFTAGKNIILAENTSFQNNVVGRTGPTTCTGSPIYSGIAIDSVPDLVAVIGNSAGSGGFLKTLAVPNCQAYGIASGAAAGKRRTFVGNMADGNVTGQISLTGAGTQTSVGNIP